jgi:hypothetical protein
MLLGQLYYYLKTLDTIKTPINSSNLNEIKLAGVTEGDLKSLNKLNSVNLERKIRDIFSQNYKQFLLKNKLSLAHNFWLSLTSPKKTSAKTFKANTAFQEVILEWQKNDFALNQLEEVLESGKLALEEEDVAIFYGLSVIHKFTSNKNSEKTLEGLIPENYVDEKAEENKDLKEHPQILVLTQDYKFPLFTNLNSICLSISNNFEEKQVLDEVQSVIKQNLEISLVLIDLADCEKLVTYLQKHLPQGILVTSLNLEKVSQEQDAKQSTFFDKIVKQTLGIRLN